MNLIFKSAYEIHDIVKIRSVPDYSGKIIDARLISSEIYYSYRIEYLIEKEGGSRQWLPEQSIIGHVNIEG